MKRKFLSILVFTSCVCVAHAIGINSFRTSEHPRIFVTQADKQTIWNKINQVAWADSIFQKLKREVDPIVSIHAVNPSYVISRMQMHWESGHHYTDFYANDNFIKRREGNAKYPTVRVTYGRAASNSAPAMPLDKIIPYGNGALTKPAKEQLGIVKITENGSDVLSNIGQKIDCDTIPFEKTGLGTETINRSFAHLAWKSSILYYLTGEKKYAKLAADILWTFVRGASQQQQVNPDWEKYNKDICMNGYLSYETLGDTRHFATLPLAYDMIYDYLHGEYFDSKQFTEGIKGELWAPPHTEGKQWALSRFEVMFKRLIENKLNRGGGLHGNWNMNEQQSAMLYALALDDDNQYSDGKGRGYYVNKLVYGPTTATHGAYVDVLHANVSPTTGLWPEAPGGYGQGSNGQLIRFGYIYYKNGLDLLSEDSLYVKAAGSMSQMLFPNGYSTNVGDASYSRMFDSPLELYLAYASEKKDTILLNRMASLMKYVGARELNDEFYYSLFFYLPEIPKVQSKAELSPVSYSKVYSLIFERNHSDDPKNALAFTLAGYGKDMGHRQPNGMTMELYGRGHVLAPDQGIGQDYWSNDSHEYKMNVAAHNTVSPNGKGADPTMPQNLEIVCAEPEVKEGVTCRNQLIDKHQFVVADNHFLTKEVDARQRRLLSIVRANPQQGYYVDVFWSKVVDGKNLYHDYYYHNMGIGSALFDSMGKSLDLDKDTLDSSSGKGYQYFKTLGSTSRYEAISADFTFGIDGIRMRMYLPQGSERKVYQLESPNNHRYYIQSLKTCPVPALMVRHYGDSWSKPFAFVYEPYEESAGRLINTVTADKDNQEGVVKLTVAYKEAGRYDYIIASDTNNRIIKYKDILFKGTYCVVSVKKDKVISAYVGNGSYLKVKGFNAGSKKNGQSKNFFLESLGNNQWKLKK